MLELEGDGISVKLMKDPARRDKLMVVVSITKRGVPLASWKFRYLDLGDVVTISSFKIKVPVGLQKSNNETKTSSIKTEACD